MRFPTFNSAKLSKLNVENMAINEQINMSKTLVFVVHGKIGFRLK